MNSDASVHSARKGNNLHDTENESTLLDRASALIVQYLSKKLPRPKQGDASGVA